VPPDDPGDAPEAPEAGETPDTDEPAHPHDGLAEALALVGDRWTLLIVAALLDGPRRFGDLQADVNGIAPNVLTQRLRALTLHGLVIASAYTERPPRFVYELSAGARELALPLQLLAGWGSAHAPGAQAPRHEVCGTPLELEWWCPVCRQTVPDATKRADADDDLHYA
jgi:DNA-binding HxlR family transcriptional regulator